MDICAIIVNYCTADLTAAALDALAAQGDLRAIVVDNASNDGSADRIAQHVRDRGYAAWASVMALEVNGGFAAGNNAAIAALMREGSPPDAFWLINPDTAARDGALTALTDYLDMHPRTGIVGSQLEDEAGRVQPAAHRFPSPLNELDGAMRLGLLSRMIGKRRVTLPPTDQPQPCDWVSGASMMIRREVVEQIGLLDEGYFLYFEEVDFCRRARRVGWQVCLVPTSRVMHLEHGAASTSPWWAASRKRYFVKSHGRAALWLADLMRGIGECAFACRRAIGLTRGGAA